MDEWVYFGSPVYSIILPEYLETAKTVSDEYIIKIKKISEINEVYPSYNSENFNYDNRISTLTTEITRTAAYILDIQGYDISNFELQFTEFWAQEHAFMGGQERHIHGEGNIITGFYFLETPENGCRLVIHEPRPAKEFGIFLPQKNINLASQASQSINFIPQAGQLIITNAYLPHTFTRNESKELFKMIHFNISAVYRTPNII